MSADPGNLDSILQHYAKLGRALADPDLTKDHKAFSATAKEHSAMRPLINKINQFRDLEKRIDEDKELLSSGDEELAAIAHEELNELEKSLTDARSELEMLLLPRDPNEGRSVIVEIRAGAGGNEASLFAGDLFRMYMRFAERRRFKCELLGSHPSEVGGFKEVSFSISGTDVYKAMHLESGTHRVQRVPVTESQGRIHTSTATVAVLPEAEDVEVEIKSEDLRIDVYRSTGPGGQSVNTTDSAVRITHLPTGIVVAIQDEKSQHKNKAKAMKVLRARIKARMDEEARHERSRARRSQVGTGDRSEKIRTYNFPQNRVTDHRIHLSMHRIEAILDGDLDELTDALNNAERQAMLADMRRQD